LASGRAGIGGVGGLKARGFYSIGAGVNAGVDSSVIGVPEKEGLMSLKYVIAALAAAACIGVASAQSTLAPATDWATFSRFLSLVHVFVQAACPPGGSASQGCDPNAAQKAFDDIANGRNAEANALMLDIFAGVPAAEREKMLAIGRTMVAVNRKQMAAEAQVQGDSGAIQARKDLTAIGLSYHDRNQFLDAVKRKDAIAVRLFLAGRGVDPNAKDAWGASALELARRGGDPEIIALLSAAAPK
jgi:hypothetical protein